MEALAEDSSKGRQGLRALRRLLEAASAGGEGGVWHPTGLWPGETILGAIIATRPTTELVIERPEGALGLCVVDGRFLAAAMEGQRLFEHPVLAKDPALSLAIEMWTEPTRDLPPLDAMRADLEFTCRYDHLFANAHGFGEHVRLVIGSLLSGRCAAVHVGPHSPSEHGTPVCEVAFQVLAELPSETRRQRIGPGTLKSPDTIPPWLRGTLPPARYGRLFFTMSEGARLIDLPHGRLDTTSLESAVLLGVLAGLIERNEEQDVHTPTDEPPFTPESGSPCGTYGRLLTTLRAVAEESRRRQKRTRLTGTRFEPVGLELADLHAYFAIGEGAYGTVEVATLAGVGGIVAAKRLREEHQDSPEILRRFHAEAALLSLMQHPHIVRGMGARHSGSEHFILMEFVHGVTLSELLRALHKQGRTLSEMLTRYIGAAIADALTHVHALTSPEGRALGIVHRDIAPPNILLSFAGDVKLADFSTAQGDDHRYAPERRGARSGRLGYMSPESLLTAPTAFADEYALGACLYEALTGHKLIEAESQAETLKAVVRGTHVPVLEHAPHLSPQFAYHLERSIAPMPHDRHACTATFADAMRKGLTGHESNELAALIDEFFGATAAREREAIARIAVSLSRSGPLRRGPAAGRAAVGAIRQEGEADPANPIRPVQPPPLPGVTT